MQPDANGVAGGQGRSAGDVAFSASMLCLPFILFVVILFLSLNGCLRHLNH